ncbi:hypothetical protein [Kocuria rosea]|uniref:hypothetical protein n=1 Tax=Kocuria rosea TaxID=1275 RepID=UPI003D32FBAF
MRTAVSSSVAIEVNSNDLAVDGVTVGEFIVVFDAVEAAKRSPAVDPDQSLTATVIDAPSEPAEYRPHVYVAGSDAPATL